MAALLDSLVSYYASYLMVAILSLALLRFYHATNTWIVIVRGGMTECIARFNPAHWGYFLKSMQ